MYTGSHAYQYSHSNDSFFLLLLKTLEQDLLQDKSQNPTIKVPKSTTEPLRIAMPGPSPVLITDLHFQHLHVTL